jgi:hypothetical protein
MPSTLIEWHDRQHPPHPLGLVRRHVHEGELVELENLALLDAGKGPPGDVRTVTVADEFRFVEQRMQRGQVPHEPPVQRQDVDGRLDDGDANGVAATEALFTPASHRHAGTGQGVRHLFHRRIGVEDRHDRDVQGPVPGEETVTDRERGERKHDDETHCL